MDNKIVFGSVFSVNGIKVRRWFNWNFEAFNFWSSDALMLWCFEFEIFCLARFSHKWNPPPNYTAAAKSHRQHSPPSLLGLTAHSLLVETTYRPSSPLPPSVSVSPWRAPNGFCLYIYSSIIYQFYIYLSYILLLHYCYCYCYCYIAAIHCYITFIQ